MENLLFLSLDIVKYNEKGQVTIASSIFILVFSMIVVFVVLLIISYMIDMMHFVLMSKSKKVEKSLDVNNSEVANVNATNDLMADTKLVAIITAAISSYMGTTSSNIHIKNIRRVEQNKSNWSMRNFI